MKKKYSIFFHGFWPGFMENEQNNVSFFKYLFNTKDTELDIADSANNAQIIISAGADISQYSNKLKILFLVEPNNRYDKSYCDIVLGGVPEYTDTRAVFVPAFVSFLYSNNLLHHIVQRPLRKAVPPNFCCMIISNKCKERVEVFNLLQTYKPVCSAGATLNNMGWQLTAPWGSAEFYQFISQFKFIITMDSSKVEAYIQEKLFHGYLSQTIPIYWGSDYVPEIFNPESMILLKESNPYTLQSLLQEVIEIDADDEKWLAKVNSPIFKNGDLPEYFKAENVGKRLMKKIDECLETKPPVEKCIIFKLEKNNGGFFCQVWKMLSLYIASKVYNLPFYIDDKEWLFKHSKGWDDYFEMRKLKKIGINKNISPILIPDEILHSFSLSFYKTAIEEIFSLNAFLKARIANLKNNLSLKDGSYISIIIRRGDKLYGESKLIPVDKYVEKILETDSTTCFLQTDDYLAYQELKNHPKIMEKNITIHTTCPNNKYGAFVFNYNPNIGSKVDESANLYLKEIGNTHSQKSVIDYTPDEMKEHVEEMLSGLMICLKGKYLITDFQSNVTRFLATCFENSSNIISVLDEKIPDLNKKVMCPAHGFIVNE